MLRILRGSKWWGSKHLAGCKLTEDIPTPAIKILNSAFWAHSKCQSAIYLLLVTSILCLKPDEYMNTCAELRKILEHKKFFLHYGHIQSTFYKLLVTSILCLKSVKKYE